MADQGTGYVGVCVPGAGTAWPCELWTWAALCLPPCFDEPGGASVLAVEAPAGSPAQVEAQGGASDVQLDGVTHTGVAGGSVFTDPGFSGAENRYAITLTAGVSDFRMVRA
jgi:hypothetical protein